MQLPAALEGRQQPLGMLVGRIVRPRVYPVLMIGTVTLLLVICRQGDRRDQRTGNLVDLAEGLRDQGLRRQ